VDHHDQLKIEDEFFPSIISDDIPT